MKKSPQRDGWKMPVFRVRRLSASSCCNWWHCNLMWRRFCPCLHEMLGHCVDAVAAAATWKFLCGLKEVVAIKVVQPRISLQIFLHFLGIGLLSYVCMLHGLIYRD